MRLFRSVRSWFLAVAIFGFLAANAGATPIAELTYLETHLGGDLWRYDYTLWNTTDSTVDPGADLFNLMIHFDETAQFLVLRSPSGWGPSEEGPGFVNFLSANAGTYLTDPPGTDIAPGDFLGGFRLQFDYQAGALLFDVLFVNLDDFDNPFTYRDASKPSAAPVPEPTTILLLSSGLAGVALFRKRRRD